MPIVAIARPSDTTRNTRSPGADPTARRTPNSRVRALTENASTLATPTTAISNAMPANPENTNALTRSGDSTSARTSSSVAARSSDWSGARPRTTRVTAGTIEYGSAAVRTNRRPPYPSIGEVGA